MKVSIITRTIDRESLQQTIDSVKNQTYENIEHIIIRGFDRFYAADEGFKIITGDIVLLLDDDDTIDPEHVAGAIKAFQSHPEVYWVNTGYKKFVNGKFHSYQGGLMRKEFFFTHSSAFFFKAELLKEFNYLDEKYDCGCEDIAFFTDIAMKYSGWYTRKATSNYNIHDGNTAGLTGAINKDIIQRCYDKVSQLKIIKQKDS